MMRLAEIWIYPVKGLAGFRTPRSKIWQKGLAYDRRWMLIDEQNRFLTQREFPRLTLFRIWNEADHFRIGYEGSWVALLKEPGGGIHLRAQVWEDTVDVQEVDPDLSRWFSGHLQKPVRLVRFAEEAVRHHVASHSGQSVPVSLADAYPLLLASRASLDDLNSRLEQPVSMVRFRPNLVVEGIPPFDEEHWASFTVGNIRLQGIKACSRCSVITIHPETAQINQEPLRMLAGYRQRNNKVFFGQNCAPEQTGEITEGDEITIHARLEAPVY